MDEELREHLSRIEKNMATKSDVDGLDKKIEKGNKEILGYIEHIDKELQEHRHNSEVHLKIPAL